MNLENLYQKLKKAKFIIAGPCVIESEKLCLEVAENLMNICERYNIHYIFKSSFDKANRTSINSFRGPGIKKGIEILEKVKNKFNIPITTDIHESWQAEEVKDVVDIIQIPAFLCRQTDLLISAGKTKNIVNIKKAQFLSGKDMKYPAEKVKSTGNNKIILTERGTIFGYGDLVVDFRNIIDMKELGYLVVFDATHSVQKPGGLGGKSGGDRKYVPYLTYCANACGVNGFFFEVHPDPDNALSDGPNMINYKQFEEILKNLFKD